ncbi:hypothetical protein F5I97DRAFT_1110515 [Phlebopus sp. FC_14]|nr:hypothetical protein F5I97DRAFT_1110515 [Phlebopus sp. FC_14]
MTFLCGFRSKSPRKDAYVIALFGQTGVGVSSLVNLIVGHPVATYSVDTKPCTLSVTDHDVSWDNKQFRLYEVPGFGGHFSDTDIIDSIQSLEEKVGIDLLVYCLRKKRETLMPENLKKIRAKMPAGIPIVAVVTELERYKGDMASWWTIPSEGGKVANGKTLEDMGMTFADHACVTTLPPEDVAQNTTFRERRSHSENVVKNLVAKHCGGSKRRPRTTN